MPELVDNSTIAHHQSNPILLNLTPVPDGSQVITLEQMEKITNPPRTPATLEGFISGVKTFWNEPTSSVRNLGSAVMTNSTKALPITGGNSYSKKNNIKLILALLLVIILKKKK